MNLPRFSPPGTKSRYIVSDANGDVSLELDFLGERQVVQDDGTTLQVRESQALELDDGIVLPPQALLSRNGVPMAVCAECRSPRFHGLRREQPSHGLILARNARKCESCGKLFCMRHTVQISDGKWRCRSCSKWSWFWRFVRRVFCTD